MKRGEKSVGKKELYYEDKDEDERCNLPRFDHHKMVSRVFLCNHDGSMLCH